MTPKATFASVRVLVILILFSLVASFKKIAAQDTSNIAQFKIGDTIPDLVFKEIRNYNKEELRLSDFKGKMVVIDVWSKWCSTCIASFSKYEKIQNKFKDSVQFLLLTENSIQDYEYLKKRTRAVSETKLPFILQDSIIKKAFPSLSLPLHIWLDSLRIVRAITNGYSTTEENINEFLKSGSTQAVLKRSSDLPDFRNNTSLLSNPIFNGPQSLHAYSVFMKNIQDYPFKSLVNYISNDSIRQPNYIGVRAINIPIGDLINFAMGPAKIVFDFKGGEKYNYPENKDKMNEFLRSYTYCYELVLPKSFADSTIDICKKFIKNKIISDISSNFGFEFRIENREYDCFNIISTGPPSFRTKIESKNYVYDRDDYYWELKGVPFGICRTMFGQLLKTNDLVFDKTGYSEKNVGVEMTLPVKTYTLESLNQEIKKYNLKLVKAKTNSPTILVKKGYYDFIAKLSL